MALLLSALFLTGCSGSSTEPPENISQEDWSGAWSVPPGKSYPSRRLVPPSMLEEKSRKKAPETGGNNKGTQSAGASTGYRLRPEVKAAVKEALSSAKTASRKTAPAPVSPVMESRAVNKDPDPAPRARTTTELKDFDLHEPLLEGVASWYGPGFHGRPTAGGETYDQYGLTAAHPTLPLGTLVEVVNKENNSRVWVRINDRGPYAKGRVIDLSQLAAKQLGMIDKGTAPVRISVVRWPSGVSNEEGLKPYTQYVVQVAAYDQQEKALGLQRSLEKKFPSLSFMLDSRPRGFMAVAAGPYETHIKARDTARKLEDSGYQALVRRLRK